MENKQILCDCSKCTMHRKFLSTRLSEIYSTDITFGRYAKLFDAPREQDEYVLNISEWDVHTTAKFFPLFVDTDVSKVKPISTNKSMTIDKTKLNIRHFQLVLHHLVNELKVGKELVKQLQANGTIDETVNGISVDLNSRPYNPVILYSTTILQRIIKLCWVFFEEEWTINGIFNMIRRPIEKSIKNQTMLHIVFNDCNVIEHMDDDVRSRFESVSEALQEMALLDILTETAL